MRQENPPLARRVTIPRAQQQALESVRRCLILLRAMTRSAVGMQTALTALVEAVEVWNESLALMTLFMQNRHDALVDPGDDGNEGQEDED
ncbi:hypothetical protein C2857_003867 [Epichloe festucae Fl1]|uniref:Uncharacterized protein n=1 Tax=Epichloe festucae (strain Fl1) TaxID=877507 RepID=A0A7S9KNZ3_EPIFF|nr:hypothetical protein C2857_003867 [Epichloe festucae Fl1]